MSKYLGNFSSILLLLILVWFHYSKKYMLLWFNFLQFSMIYFYDPRYAWWVFYMHRERVYFAAVGKKFYKQVKFVGSVLQIFNILLILRLFVLSITVRKMKSSNIIESIYLFISVLLCIFWNSVVRYIHIEECEVILVN